MALGESEVVDEGSFGDFELDGFGRRVVLAKGADDDFRVVFARELDAGDVDGDAAWEQSAAVPVGGLLAGFVEDEGTKLEDEPGFFCKRDEEAGRNVAALRIIPANEGFEASDVACRVEDGLIVKREFILFDSVVKKALCLVALIACGEHFS